MVIRPRTMGELPDKVVAFEARHVQLFQLREGAKAGHLASGGLANNALSLSGLAWKEGANGERIGQLTRQAGT